MCLINLIRVFFIKPPRLSALLLEKEEETVIVGLSFNLNF
jgi:hypothetical protein